MVKKVDHSALRVNQACIITFTLLAFLLDQPLLALFVAMVMGVGTVVPNAALFKQLYLKVLRPRGIVKPDVIEDDPMPHQFAQGLGSGVLFLAVTALTNGSGTAGWGLTLVVSALAGINLFFGFCAGCFMYYQLGRYGIVPASRRQGRG